MSDVTEVPAAQAVTRSRTIVANGVRTHYTEAGEDGPVIVALHGGGAGSSGGAGMGGLLQVLGKKYRVVAVDGVGGFGLTDTNARAPYGTQSRVDQLEDVVDALGLDRFIILGNSQGAWVAAKYAILHPDRVSAMLLVASATITAAMGIPEEFTPAFKALSEYDYTREGMRKLMGALVVDQSKLTEELLESRFASSTRPGAREALAAFVQGHKYLQSDIMRPNFDMRTSLPLITKHIPTAFAWGEQDAFAPARTGRQLEPMLPDVKFHFIDGAGHQVQTDQPERLAAIIDKLGASG